MYPAKASRERNREQHLRFYLTSSINITEDQLRRHQDPGELARADHGEQIRLSDIEIAKWIYRAEPRWCNSVPQHWLGKKLQE